MFGGLTFGFALLGGLWLVFALLFSRHAVWLLLLWIPVQGWLQLNVFEDSNATVLLYEFQVIGLYVVFAVRALRSPGEYRPPALLKFAVPFVLWTLLLIPTSVAANGLVMTLLGLRTYLVPLPLIWIGYCAFRTRQQLENVAWLLMLQLPLIAIVTTTQFLSISPTSLTGEVVDLPTGFMQSGIIRPPGTFSAPGQLGVYLLFSIPFAIGLLGLHAPLWKRFGFMIGLVAAIVALMANTQRATIALLIVILPLIPVMARRFRALTGMAAAVAVVVAGVSIGSQVISGAFRERVASIQVDARNALITSPTLLFTDALRTPMFGGGLGIASPGAGRLAEPLGTPNTRPIETIKPSESFTASLVYQTGVPGLVLFAFFIAVLLRAGLRAVRDCRKTDMALLAAAIIGFEIAICLQSWTYGPLHFLPSRVLFWLWGGLLLRLPQLAVPMAAPARLGTRLMAGRRPGAERAVIGRPAPALRRSVGR